MTIEQSIIQCKKQTRLQCDQRVEFCTESSVRTRFQNIFRCSSPKIKTEHFVRILTRCFADVLKQTSASVKNLYKRQFERSDFFNAIYYNTSCGISQSNYYFTRVRTMYVLVHELASSKFQLTVFIFFSKKDLSSSRSSLEQSVLEQFVR